MKTPSYDLSALKNHFDSVDKLRMTRTARESAIQLGFDDYELIEVIQELKKRDFYKSMSSKKIPAAGKQDVYKTYWQGLYLYIKFQDFYGYIVVSFKLV